jgi:hypothetical protein
MHASDIAGGVPATSEDRRFPLTNKLRKAQEMAEAMMIHHHSSIGVS